MTWRSNLPMGKYGSDWVFMRQPYSKRLAFICGLNSVKEVSESSAFKKWSGGSLQSWPWGSSSLWLHRRHSTSSCAGGPLWVTDRQPQHGCFLPESAPRNRRGCPRQPESQEGSEVHCLCLRQIQLYLATVTLSTSEIICSDWPLIKPLILHITFLFCMQFSFQPT